MIRLVENKDLGAVFELVNEFATSFVPEEDAFRTSFAALSSAANTHFAVAEVQGSVVGYVLAFHHVTFYANGRVAWVEELMVQPAQRKQGIGTALLSSVETWASGQNCKLIAVATRHAAQFYEAIGYQASATYFRKLL